MEKIDTPDSSNSVIEKSSSGFGHIAVLYAHWDFYFLFFNAIANKFR